jgi:hypothetical protein
VDTSTKKEFFSYAYIQAVASIAGFSVIRHDRSIDNSGIDLTIRSPDKKIPQLDLQVKCTELYSVIDNKEFSYALEVHNYKHLIDSDPDIRVPMILVVVVVPKEIDEWMLISPEKTIVQKCGYWISLCGQPPTDNTSKISIRIPLSSQFTPESLKEIMNKIKDNKKL